MAKSGPLKNGEPAELVEIRWVSTVRHLDPRERVQAVGGMRKGVAWKLTQSAAIGLIERDEASFYMQAQGHCIAIVIATTRDGRKYLKAITDPTHPTTLLSLPECPDAPRTLQSYDDWHRNRTNAGVTALVK
jgi:hypothetical protein